MNEARARILRLAVSLGLAFGLALPITGSGCSSSPSAPGSGGAPAGSGGVSGSSGGTMSTGGAAGAGGVPGSGGVMGLGGVTGSGGTTASGGTTGAGGEPASGGTTGSGGSSASGGAAGGRGGTASGGGGQGGAAVRNGGSSGAAGAGGVTIPSTITLTSPVLVEGGMFAAGNTCADPGMGSPELDWTPGPPGTMSYAVTLSDLTDGIVQWAIWNIPVPSGTPTKIILPAHLDTVAMLTTPMGAVQVNGVNGRGYYGPCLAGGTHTYRFQVYAVPTASLTELTNSAEVASASVRAIAIATGTLTATSNATH